MVRCPGASASGDGLRPRRHKTGSQRDLLDFEALFSLAATAGHVVDPFLAPGRGRDLRQHSLLDLQVALECHGLLRDVPAAHAGLELSCGKEP